MLGAMILAGGAASRMGQDKAAQLWAGVRAIDRVADLARQLGCDPVISVGTLDYGLPLARDAMPLAGPVGGVMAGAAMLREAGRTRALVLAVDTPTLTPDDLRPLIEAPGTGAAYEALHLPAVVDLAALPDDPPAGWPIRLVWDHAKIARLKPAEAAVPRLRGANTPPELEALIEELKARG